MRYMQARITGHVQGVGFRQATVQRAHELGVVGYVRNCDDGSVEVGAAGSDEQVAILVKWLETGPTASRVDQVTSQDIEPQAWSTFQSR